MGALRSMGSILAFTAILLGVAVVPGCGPHSRESGGATGTAVAGGDWAREGRASWYGGAFHGKRTANGERYDMHAMTAAHRSLPFGTELEVTRIDTGQKVRVRVNDRGPYAKGRILDLSKAAARKLNILKVGVARVRLRIVAEPRER